MTMLPLSLSDLTLWADRFAPLLLNACLRATVILALAGCAALCLRRAAAAVRHCVWFLALVSLLAIPLLSAGLPAWHILLPAPRAMTPANAPSPTPLLTAAPALPNSQSNPAIASSPPVLRQLSPQTAPPTPAAAMSTAQRPSPRSQQAIPITLLLMLCWFSGAAIILLYVFLGHLSLAILQRRCSRFPGTEVASQMARLQKQIGLDRRIMLLSSPHRSMPMTWGVWSPRILLPQEAVDWPLDKREAVLLHELAHIRRRDCAAQPFAQLACAMYWFNPLVWIAWRRMQVERERACDDIVLNAGARASSYAQHLLKSAALPAPPLVSAAAAMARPSTLEERLRAILDPHPNRSVMTMRTTAAASLLFLAALVPVALVQGQETDPPTPAKSFSPPLPARSAPTSRPAASSIRSRMGGFGASSSPSDITGPACTFDAIIYELHLPVDQLAAMNLDDFTRTATVADFQKSLDRLGESKLLYRANQSVRLSSDRITIGSQIPVITNSQQTAKGTVNSVSYQNVGAIFDITGKSFGADGINLNLDLQISSVADNGTPISENVKAPIFHTATLAFKGMAQPNQAFYIVTSDAATRDDKDRATAYIARVTLGEPQTPPPSPAPSPAQ